ncbi:MAG: DUF2934 domain-containing protein [Myxococcales bacterium]|nr:DUF2934 domain-containing protein [Myxococcales bacterium]
MAAKKSEKKPIVTASAVDESSTNAQRPARKPPARVAVAAAPETLAPVAPVAPVAPTHDEIRERAHAIHLGGAGGSSVDNWLRAERDIRSERGFSA